MQVKTSGVALKEELECREGIPALFFGGYCHEPADSPYDSFFPVFNFFLS
jgi:hypothetical protein